MERHGYVPAIQGGGTGIGFRPPRQIWEYEPHVFSKLQLQIMASFDKEKNCGTEDNEESKRLVWRREAEHRLKTLAKRKSIITQHYTNLSKPFAISEGSKARNADNVQDPAHQKCNIAACSAASAVGATHEAANSSQTLESIAVIMPNCKFIPNLPPALEDVVRLWRFGEKKTGFKPVRLFLTASSRRVIVKNYTDKYWNRSGQKAAFYRFKDIVEFVSEHGPLSLKLKTEGRDADWEYGIANVKKLSLFSKSRVSMSALLRLIRGENKVAG